MLDTLKDWLGTFWRVLIAPTPETFLAESKKADGKFASAVGWLVFYAVYLYILVNIFIAPTSFAVLLADVLLLPLAVVMFTSVTHVGYQRITERKNYVYDKLLYLTVAILLPLQLVAAPVSLVLPRVFGQLLVFLLLVYQLALLLVALKTIGKIEYWEAILSVFVGAIATILIVGIVGLLIYSTVAGPTAGRPQ